MILILLALLAVSVFSHPVDPNSGPSFPPSNPGPISGTLVSVGCNKYLTCLKNIGIASRYTSFGKVLHMDSSITKGDILLLETCNTLYTCELATRHHMILEQVSVVNEAIKPFRTELKDCVMSVAYEMSNCASYYSSKQDYPYVACMSDKARQSEFCTDEEAGKILAYGKRVADGIQYIEEAIEVFGKSDL